MIMITSRQNPVVKEVRSLKSRKDREEKNLFFIEGARIVREAVKENADIAYVVMTEDFIAGTDGIDLQEQITKSGCKMYVVSDSIYREMTDTETPQGILAVVGMKQPDFTGKVCEDSLYVLLDSIRDPGNMGTIIRTADAAGFSGVIISRGCVDAYNPKVLRATMGSIFHIPVYHCDDILDAIRHVKSRGIRVYASHLEGSCSIYEADMTSGAAVIIGSEAEGISGEAASQADVLVRIPMPGKAESLNASVAAGIMMYEAVRQRQHVR